MLSLLSLAFLGLLFGVRHATDPDHVVAVTTFVSRRRSVRAASGVGMLWGIGHTGTILVVGGALVLLKLAIVPRVGLGMEFAVALMLVSLGVVNLLGVRRSARGECAATVRPVLVGVMHGLDGSAAVALAALTQIGDAWGAVAYLFVFGVGTILGMLLITTAIAIPSAYAAQRVAGLQHWFRLTSGAASLCVGLYLAHRAGVVNGLFSAHPRWTPE
jgi:high-affinity nickel permease